MKHAYYLETAVELLNKKYSRNDVDILTSFYRKEAIINLDKENKRNFQENVDSFIADKLLDHYVYPIEYQLREILIEENKVTIMCIEDLCD